MSRTLADLSAAAQGAPAGTAGHLVSLDAFRGIVMAFMILVNTPGDGRHVYWPQREEGRNGGRHMLGFSAAAV